MKRMKKWVVAHIEERWERKRRMRKMIVVMVMERQPNTLVEICHKACRRERGWNHKIYMPPLWSNLHMFIYPCEKALM